MRIKALLTGILALFILTSAINASNPPADEDVVKQVVTTYVTGTDTKNADALESVLHDAATIVGHNKLRNQYATYSSDEYVDAVKRGRIGGWKRQLSITSVDVTDGTAMAKIIVTDSKLKQFEYITLIKVDGAWKITNSTYSVEKV